MRVLLAYTCSEDGRADFFERILPIGLCQLHATLIERGHASRLANFSRTGRRAIEAHLRELQPELVGISTFTFNRHASLRLAALVKRTLPSARVVLGGPHATHVHRAILEAHPAVDWIVIGEGEDTLVRLVACLEAGGDPTTLRGIAGRRGGSSVVSGWPEPIADLDALPHAGRHLEGHGVDGRTQRMYLITSRGCPARCTFCNTPEFWGTRIRFRSVDHVMAELRSLRQEHGLLYVSFRDDTFTAHRPRILELCRRMQEEKLYFLWDCQSRVNAVDPERLVAMRRAGCLHVQYGVESGSPAMLERLNKDIRLEEIEAAADATRGAGLVFSVYLISGIDGESDEDVARTEAMLRRIRPHDAMVSPLAVFPGTAIWERYRDARGLDDRFWGGRSREDVYVGAAEPAAERALARIGAAVESIAADAAYTLEDYARLRAAMGAHHALDLCEADLHESLGDLGAAREILEALERREPENPWPPLRLGQIDLAARRFADAAARFERLVAVVPKSFDGWWLYGRSLGRLGRRLAAAEALETARRLDPSHPGVRRGLRRLGVVEASAPIGPRPSGAAAYLRHAR